MELLAPYKAIRNSLHDVMPLWHYILISFPLLTLVSRSLQTKKYTIPMVL
jgi:hypothetical protein